MAIARQILQIFDTYQKARISFVEQIADLASHPTKIPALDKAGALALLQPLLSDVCPSVQQYAATAIGRLANHSDKMAQSIARKDILSTMLRGLDKQNKYYKKAMMFVIRAVSKHSPELAGLVIKVGGLEAMLLCMEDFDSTVKLAAVWAVSTIASHSRSLAQATIDAGCVPLLVLCLQEPELCLKQAAASALAEIAKHGKELAQTIIDCSGSLCLLSKMLHNQDPKLKRQVLVTLDAIATHNLDLAESCVEAEIFPTVLLHSQHLCSQVSKAACALTRDVVKHSLELSQLIVNQGGIAALLAAEGDARIPAYTAIGYIAGQSEQLALAAVNGVSTISNSLDSTDGFLQSAAVWSLGQIGKHTGEHARYLAEANVFQKVLNIYLDPDILDDLRIKCNSLLKQCLQKCMILSAIEPLLHEAPPEILKYVLGQYAKILPNDARQRRLFVTTGGLKKIQEIPAEPGSTLLEYILCINACFPEEVVRFYSPGYQETFLDKVDQYTPRVCLTEFGRLKDDDELSRNLSEGN